MPRACARNRDYSEPRAILWTAEALSTEFQLAAAATAGADDVEAADPDEDDEDDEEESFDDESDFDSDWASAVVGEDEDSRLSVR